jgi:hypothetical protein
MSFIKKYNTIFKTVDNVLKLYKIYKKKDDKTKEDKK